MSCNKLGGRQINTLTKRTGIATVNRNCLSQSQHTSLLSTPKGWTPHGLSFLMKKCRKTGGPAANGRRRETGKHVSSDVNTTLWSHFVKQFLQSAEYNLAPATRIILTKILPSRVNFSDPKWSNYRNTQTELCRFLSDLNPDCDSINWKGDFFRTLSSLIFNYMVQILCSGRISKKQKMAHVILKKINDVTNEYVLLNSPDNFLQGVQIFVANMLSPWLEKPINYICNKGTSNKDSTNENTINEIEDQKKIGIESKHSKTNEVIQNKTNKLRLETAKKINQKSKIGKFTKTIVKSRFASQNPNNKATKIIKMNRKSKKGLKFPPVASAADDSEKIIENHKILSDSALVSRPGSNNAIKKKIKNNMKSKHIKSKNKQKSKKSKISKTTVKGSLSMKNPDKATKNRKTTKSLKSKTVITAVHDSEIIIENNKMLSNSILVKNLVGKNANKTKIKSEKKSNILNDKSLTNTNGRGEYTNEENGNNGSTTGNEKLLKSTKQFPNDNTFVADSNNNKKNQFINEYVESLQQATDAEDTQAIIDDGRNDDGQRILTVNKSSKSHYGGDGKLLLSEHGSKPTATIPNRISDSHYYNANEDDGVLNVTDYSKHSVTASQDLSGEKYDINRLKGEELLLKYNDKISLDVDNDGYSDVNTDYDNGFDDDDGHHILIMNEDGDEFESRILDDLANVFLDSSSAGWSNKHDNGITATESRGDESKRNRFQICADDYAHRLLADTFRNKALARPEVCDQSTGVSYNIRKKDGSNYSVRKTILPQCNNRDLQCTMCPLDKSKLVVNTLIELKD
ncbi:MATH and LRR domain-containing protein PFE0570w-like [Myzus persicae]|uniref:MATH and LRR domain-containing protein PFE0570w-like n=1 Tax=Myzus persicae TaxID=13164 RepID=UPI000B938012|nr:MATH and LRR domain-containing protein PFE0570w-like [Myzus persicae]